MTKEDSLTNDVSKQNSQGEITSLETPLQNSGVNKAKADNTNGISTK
jgi:hypothetical protein